MDKASLGVDSIFLTALDIASPAERATYLDEACGADSTLRRRVERLLAAHPQAAGSFLESPPDELQHTIEMPPIKEGPGTVIGHYKLLQQIGEGGFGVVYMAEQQEPVRRKVALKLIKPGMDTREVIARFEAERQALALMDHPHIARVLDAGATDSGRPYFVMELVRGIPITDYCDQNSLGFRERLELFTSVCQAVQHAHQKGIIHRDVKPTNVLVTLHDGKPVVKVIDFGVAKAIDRRLTERTLFTRFAEMIGTPLYMSPEQAEMSGLDVDTRTDIYSLGVLLYELLTGSTPFDKERLGKAAYDEIRRIIREEEPPRPSTRVSTLGAQATAVSEHRKTEPRKLSALLKGDLDWIVMKALEKDRTRRYETAKEFADDIQHYLNDQPVEARAPSRLYRFQKLVRRYRVAAATVIAIAVTLIAATIFSTAMAVSAIRSREQAERSREKMMVANEAAVQEKQRAEAEAQKARKAAADAELALEVFTAALTAGESARLTSPDQEVSGMLQQLVEKLDGQPEPNAYVEANVRYAIGLGYWNIQRAKEAHQQFRLALEARRKAVKGVDARTADLLNWVGMSSITAGHPEEAEQYLRECVAAWRTIGGGEASIGEARALCDIAGAFVDIGKGKEALEIAQQSLTLARQSAGEDHGMTGWCAASVATCYGALGDTDSQIAHLREALAVFERIRAMGEQWDMWTRLGHVYRDLGQLSDAKDSYSRALQLCDGLGVMSVERRHQTTMSLSDVLFRLREWPEAEKIHRDFLEAVQGMIPDDDRRVAKHQLSLACALVAQRKSDEADALLRASLARMDEDGLCASYLQLATVLHSVGRYMEAKERCEQALQMSVNLDIQKRHEATFSLAGMLSDLRDFGAAEQLYREFLRFAEDKLQQNDPRMCAERYSLAWALHVQGRKEESVPIFRDLYSVFQLAIREGRAVWRRDMDRLVYSEMVGMTSSDEVELQEAIQILEEIESTIGQDRFLRTWWNGNRALLEEKRGRNEDAIHHARLFVEHADTYSPEGHRMSREMLVRLLTDAGQHDEAEQVLREAVEDCEQQLGDANIITNYVRADLVDYLMTREEYAAADEPLRRAQSLVADTRVPVSQRKRIAQLLVKYCEATGNPEEAAQWRATEAVTGNGEIGAKEG